MVAVGLLGLLFACTCYQPNDIENWKSNLSSGTGSGQKISANSKQSFDTFRSMSSATSTISRMMHTRAPINPACTKEKQD